MNEKISELKKDLYRILPTLKRVSRVIEEELPSSGFRDELDEEEHFWIDQLRSLNHRQIEDLVSQLEYLDGEVVAEGYLRLNENDRYECDGVEISSGSKVEVFVYDHETRQSEWILTRLEYADRHGGYYSYEAPELELSGVRARIRRR